MMPQHAISYSPDAHYVLPTGASIVFFINNTDTGEHPIHIHGHAFWVLATSERPEVEVTYAASPCRRDVVSIPAKGWVKIAFVADNPGVWALHCHIDWHVAAGLMMEMFEATAGLQGLVLPPQHEAVCGYVPSMQEAVPTPTAAPANTTCSSSSSSTSSTATVTGLAVAVAILGFTTIALAANLAMRSGGTPQAVKSIASPLAPDGGVVLRSVTVQPKQLSLREITPPGSDRL